MQQGIFTVFDMAAKMFLEPFFAPTVEVAIRGFSEACRNPDHNFNRHPEDFALYHIGEYDATSAVIVPFEARKVAMASSYHNAPDLGVS